MLQNKIYQNFFIEIIKIFLTILLGLSILAFTVRAVNFLDLIVYSGYPVSVYFQYSTLNLFGIIPKFIPLAFLLTLIIFILKHLEDKEFVILWTSGVRKLDVINLIFSISLFILFFHLLFSTIITPFALNKSRLILSNDKLNNFLPTIRPQQFNDSFTGFTFFVEKKSNTKLENIFIYDTGNNLKKFTSNTSKNKKTSIISKSGIVKESKLFLFSGQIINSEYETNESDKVKFDKLIIDLSDLNTTTIKTPKLQETSTISLLSCFKNKKLNKICESENKEIIPTLNRRIVVPFYIPALTIICSLLFLRGKNFYINKISIFFYSFVILLFTELALRYTGLSNLMKISFIAFPFIIIGLVYSFLYLKLSKKQFINE